jgi:hypothetical protein
MAKTSFSGRIQRFNGDNLELDRRVAFAKTVTEYGGQKITIGPASKNISVIPAGLARARTIYIETDNQLNVEITGEKVASFNILSNGICMLMNSSISNIRLSNRSATNTCKPFCDISG